MTLLDSIGDFNGLRGLGERELNVLCAEIRELILNVTLQNGGHLSSSLGAVELTVALLRVFNPDKDKIIFDVGHQSYAYKILTKRAGRFRTLRQRGGIAGFPRMDESPYDFFTTGHSSTSISAAMGYAKARDLKNESHEIVAVIGDGALLNGLSFEALNAMASVKSKVIIVLNDNKMSINPRIGGMASHLAKLAVSPTYKKFKDYVKYQCAGMKNGENIRQSLSLAKQRLKALLLPPNIFEELGISYWGPFNGHNIGEMEEVFRLARYYDKSLLVHVLTQKGRGCKAAEKKPSFFHGIAPMTKTDATEKQADGERSWSSAVSRALCEIAEKDERIMAGTAAMKDGTKLGEFAKRYPERFFDAGIEEEHLIVYAAGLAAAGMRPAVCVYSTFLQRAMDQIAHDICLPKLPVLLCIDRAGLVGEDGETHQGVLDVPWLRSVPDLTFAAPRDTTDLKFFVEAWRSRDVPMAIRYPRCEAQRKLARNCDEPAGWGKCEILREGSEICLVGVGSTVSLMLDAADEMSRRGPSPTVIDLRFIKPIDEEGLLPLLASHRAVITAEENALAGGVGVAIAALMKEHKISASYTGVGAPDRFIQHATRAEQWEECGLTVENILKLCGEAI